VICAHDPKSSAGGEGVSLHSERGYVGVGVDIGKPATFANAMIDVDGTNQRLADQTLVGNYEHAAGP